MSFSYHKYYSSFPAMANISIISLLWFILPIFTMETPPDIEDLISQSGYPVESHEIETADGYLLTYHRIPYGKRQENSRDRNLLPGIPVLLQHGIMCSSAGWVLGNESLGFALADAGYDVWLGNARGNTFSRRHRTLDPDKDSTFWTFSFHEMGSRDLPAAIDYILAETDQQQLFYVGHSMGTTMYFVLGASRPQYMTKIKAMVALAPVVFPWNISSPIIILARSLYYALVGVIKFLQKLEIFPYSRSTSWINENICSIPRYKFICHIAFGLMDGFKGKQINRTPLSKILSYVPAGSSFRNFLHYGQLLKKGIPFGRYVDEGPKNESDNAGSFTPTAYDLDNVTAPMYVYYGANDWVATPKDVLYAVKFFPNVKKVTEVPHKKFSHLDFMWTTEKHLLFDDVISTLNEVSVEQE